MNTAPAQLTALTIPVASFGPSDDLDPLLPHLSPSGVWLREGEGLIGLGTAGRAAARGTERFAVLAHWFDAVRVAGSARTLTPDLQNVPGTGLAGFVTVTYAADSATESALVVPEIVLGRAGQARWITVIRPSDSGPTGDPDSGPADLDAALSIAAPLLRAHGLTATIAPGAIASGTAASGTVASGAVASGAGGSRSDGLLISAIADGGAERTGDPALPRAALPQARLSAGTHPEQHYLDAVRAGVSAIAERRLEKLVLARDTLVRTDSPVPVGALLRELARDYRGCWTYLAGSVLGATPEMLVQVRGDQLSARVLAGTVDGAVPPEQARDALMQDSKQRSEHQLAVESLLVHLKPVTSSLSAQDPPRILALPNVYHLATDVTGTLSHDPATPGRPGSADGEPDGGGPGLLSPLFVAERAHPTAAICGTPTATAQHMISSLEEMDRGPFSGPVGWIDGHGNADVGIALRGGVLEEGGTAVRLFAGCGIVAGSEPAAELAETWAKMRPMLGALRAG